MAMRQHRSRSMRATAFIAAATSCSAPPSRASAKNLTRRNFTQLLISTALSSTRARPTHGAPAQTQQATAAPSWPSSRPTSEAVGDIDPYVSEPVITHRVCLELEIPSRSPHTEQIILALYGTLLPHTVQNFVELTKSHAYDETAVYRIVPGLTVQLGDTLHNKGKSGRAATSEGTLAVENHRVSHSGPGIVSMVVSNNAVDSRFFITTRRGDSRYLDGKYVAFGRVQRGLEALFQLEREAERLSRGPVRRALQARVVSASELPH